MTDKMKRGLFWIGVFPIILGAWTSFSTAIYNIDTVVDTFMFLTSEYDDTGMSGYEIMELMVKVFTAREGITD